jgi:hypothetical protein
MKTWVVRLPNNDRDCWMGNAESAEEAVAYAIAKGNISLADEYVVYDWNLDRTVVSRDGSADSSGDAGEPGV